MFEEYDPRSLALNACVSSPPCTVFTQFRRRVTARDRYACVNGEIQYDPILPTGDSLPQGLQRPRVLIADDNAGVCTAVSRLLSPSCDVVACAVDIATLLDATVRLRPDVVLLDLSLPGELTGFEACRRLLRVTPEVKIVALTAHDDEHIRRGAYEAGCSGFVWKLQAPSELLSTIQVVVDGTSRSADADPAEPSE